LGSLQQENQEVNFKITIRESEVRGMINRTFGPGIRRQLLGRGGAELIKICRENFGQSGIDRPVEWAPLKNPIRQGIGSAGLQGYAKKVGRFYATLYKTGKLFRSGGQIWDINDDRAIVGFADEKASWHQFGTSKMPARPFMPFWGNRLSPYAERRIITAMQLELQRIVRGGPASAIY
jgi:phage gpG-like protein